MTGLHDIHKIISGGQTGVDRAALDAAIAAGIRHGGYCPKGRLAEDGIISPIYQLIETESTDYAIRTEANVLSSDGTLILYQFVLSGGSQLTHSLCMQHGKPVLPVDLIGLQTSEVIGETQDWLQNGSIQILNIAGPRESERSVYSQARSFLEKLLND